MSRSLRRYEILLPRRFNDGTAVPDNLIADTMLELEVKFGSMSSESQVIHGHWQHLGESFRDELVRVFLDVEDTPEYRQFFVEYKETLKGRFRQIEIWVTTHVIEAL
jgi:hypothetical protein